MQIKIHTFASLKDFFDQEFSLEVRKESSVENLLQHLVGMKPQSAALLKSCRIAINENFVSKQYVINDGENIYLIPPSSGG